MTLTAERLREVLSYDPDTGEFIRLQSRYKDLIGKSAGCPQGKGYLTIMVDGVLYLAHRLAWLYVYGVWPNGQIDHENENKIDNRLSNLRDATQVQNMHNQSQPQRNNQSGYRGVCFHKGVGKYQAQLGIDGKVKHLGYFDTAKKTSKAYEVARKSL